MRELLKRNVKYVSRRSAPICANQRRSAGERAEDGTRTRYLQLGKLSLYQVSYFRMLSQKLKGKSKKYLLIKIQKKYKSSTRVINQSTSQLIN